jgi:TonB-dependent starch-binding outer membrane protein SusC
MKNFKTKEGIVIPFKKLLLMARLTMFVMILGLLQVSAESYSQTAKLKIKMKNVPVIKVFSEIERISQFRFFYDNDLVDLSQKVSIDAQGETITEVLDEIFLDTELDYEIMDRFILVKSPHSKQMLTVRNRFAQQQHTVSGKVTDVQTGEPLPGVNIVIEGTTQGSITDMEGNYTIEAPADATLVFSFVGYQNQTIKISGRQEIGVAMEQKITELGEVVAIGYGSLQRDRISTSISKIESKAIEKQVTASIDRSLEGQVAGLDIKQATGAPGGGSILRIRGSGSIGAGDQPLFVIDGIPIQNSYGRLQNPLTTIDQSDIESIDVLKGVSATSIYGSRGSNGIIIITTKSGKPGETEVSFNLSSGISHQLACEKLNVMNAEEFARWRVENRYEEAEFYGYDISLSDIPEEYRHPEELGKGVDWQDVISRVAPQQQYNLNVSHGSENFMSFFSIGYLDEKGTIIGSNFKRLNLRGNFDYNFNDLVKIGLKLQPNIRWWDFRTGQYRADGYGIATITSPLDGPYKDDGIWENEQYFDGKYDIDIYSSDLFHCKNPLHEFKTVVDKTKSFDLNIQPNIQITPLEGLNFMSRLSMELNHNSREYFRPSTVSSIYSPPYAATYGSYSTGRSFNWQFENTLNYEKELGNHTFSGLVGYVREHYNSYSSSLSSEVFPSDAIKTLNEATDLSGGTWESNWSMISYLYRLSYDYKVKYIFTGTLRRDGSSRFGSERRWGYFPSVSVGWNVTKENFLPNPEWLTNLKLRASYGFSGNNNIGNYTWIPNVVQYDYTLGGSIASGKRIAGIENVNLTWEKSQEFDGGLDLALFKGKLNLMFDYYKKTTRNMLWSVNMPISSGFNSMMKNIGKIRNKGVEFSINSVNISNNNFTWETDFNIAFNRNKVLDLGEVKNIRLSTLFKAYSITTEGQPMAMFYGWKSLGILKNQEEVDKYATFPGQLPGTPHFEDKDGNNVIDGRDQMIIGNPHPDFRGGLNNRFNYKNWDFNITTTFAHNFDIFARLEEDLLNLDGVFNVLKEVKERWRSPDEPGNGRIAASFHQTEYDRYGTSDAVYKDISFLKIQNLSIGYTFDNLIFTNQFRLFCSVQNAFLFTNYRYGNPDVNYHDNESLRMNIDDYSYPLSRSIVLGLNMNF